MQRQFLFATVAVAALSLGAAVAQTGGTGGSGGAGGTGGSTTTSPGSGGASGGGATQPAPRSGTTGSDKSTGQAPGLEQRGSPPPGVGQGSDRAAIPKLSGHQGQRSYPHRRAKLASDCLHYQCLIMA